MTPKTGWSHGYPTGVDYLSGFYRDFAPGFLRLMCRLQGVSEPEGPLRCLDLGCGTGFSVNALAATNPSDHFVGVDFLPSHIVEGRRLAAQAGLQNVDLIEASFEELAQGQELGSFDLILLHGVYSWIASEQRLAVRRIIERSLKPGGLVYLTYNNMTGSAALLPLQRALRVLNSSSSDPDALKGTVDRLQGLDKAGFEYFQVNPQAQRILADLAQKDPRYIAHEFLVDHWTPLYFQDVVQELGECKLSFVGSTNPTDNLPKFSLTTDMSAAVAAERDPERRELLRDLAMARRFRKDLFARGSVQLDPQAAVEALGETRLALATPAFEISGRVTTALGYVELRRPIYGAVLTQLKAGPQLVQELMEIGPGAAEVLSVLLQGALVHPCPPEDLPSEPAHQFNLAVTANAAALGRYGFAAAPVIGTAIPVKPFDRPLLAFCLRNPDADEDQADTAYRALVQEPAYAAFAPPSTDIIDEPAAARARITQLRAFWRGLGLRA